MSRSCCPSARPGLAGSIAEAVATPGRVLRAQEKVYETEGANAFGRSQEVEDALEEGVNAPIDALVRQLRDKDDRVIEVPARACRRIPLVP